MDLIRKRLQIQGPHVDSYAIANAPRYKTQSVYFCLREIIRTEGFLALYKGLIPGLIKAAPASAVTFLVFGKSIEFISRLKVEKTNR